MKVGGDVTPASLRQYGIKTLVLSESCVFTQKDKQKATMDLLYNDEIKLGKIFGKRAEAEALVEDWKQQLQALPQRPADTQPRKVFVYDSGEDKPFTSGKYAMPTAIIEAAGGKNAMESLEMSWGTTSGRAWRPRSRILLSCWTIRPAVGQRHCATSLENHPLMKLTPAVKHHRYLKLQYAELTPGPANIQAVEKLAHALYSTDAP